MTRYTRRNFIKRTASAMGTLGFAVGCRRLQVSARNDNFSRGAVDRLRAKLKGHLILVKWRGQQGSMGSRLCLDNVPESQTAGQ